MRDDELGDEICADPRRAPLDARRRAIVDFSVTLTVRPGAVTEDDVHALRDVGLEDADILGVVEVAAYYAYANRIADGLGVKVEDDLTP